MSQQYSIQRELTPLAGRVKVKAAGMLMVASCTIAGCTVGPDYVRPTMQSPAGYKETEGWKVAQPQDAIARGKWWEMYGDFELNALMAQVQIANLNVAQAEAAYRQARAVAQAARAAYFPTLAIGASITRSAQSTTLGRALPSQIGTVTDYLLPLDLTWELDLWGRVRRNVESQQANAQASAADYENIQLSAQAELAQDYFLLRALDTQKQLLDASAAAFDKSLQLTKNRYAGGVASRADVAQAETQLRTTQAQAIDVTVQRAQLEHAIAILIGRPPSAIYAAAGYAGRAAAAGAGGRALDVARAQARYRRCRASRRRRQCANRGRYRGLLSDGNARGVLRFRDARTRPGGSSGPATSGRSGRPFRKRCSMAACGVHRLRRRAQSTTRTLRSIARPC